MTAVGVKDRGITWGTIKPHGEIMFWRGERGGLDGGWGRVGRVEQLNKYISNWKCGWGREGMVWVRKGEREGSESGGGGWADWERDM